MSYLERPRLTFAGRFEADVSTVNNDPVHFDDATFQPDYNDPKIGWWNPTGTGIFRLVDCRVTSAQLVSGDCEPSDPVLTMSLRNAADRAAAKLVDLDPMQQMVSTIFGLRMRLTAGDGEPDIVSGDFTAAPFTDIWFTRGGRPRTPASLYQSVLTGANGGPPAWSASLGESLFLREFRELAGDRPLSVRFLVDAFVTSSDNPLFPTGRIIGSIGIAKHGEPRHFVHGRHLFVPLDLSDPKGSNYGNPVRADVNNAVAVISGSTLLLDVGNALSANGPGEPLADKGTIAVGVIPPDRPFIQIGALSADYTKPGWLEHTGGIVEIALGGDQAMAEAAPIALSFTPQGSPAAVICPREEPGGRHVRADHFVFRADPGDIIETDIYVSQFGRPIDGEVDLAQDLSGSYLYILQGQKNAPPPSQPANALAFPNKLLAKSGKAALTIKTSDPDNPRGYIDGQVYTVRPTLAGIPAEYVNGSDTISILLFDKVETSARPTWWGDVQPILQQYANLYPIMRKVLDLDDYASVIGHKDMLSYVFGLPIDDPNYMPVTRDLSGGKRRMLLDWLADASEPALGPPPPRLSAPGLKLQMRRKPAGKASGPPPEIDGKEHARKAMLATRKPEQGS